MASKQTIPANTERAQREKKKCCWFGREKYLKWLKKWCCSHQFVVTIYFSACNVWWRCLVGIKFEEFKSNLKVILISDLQQMYLHYFELWPNCHATKCINFIINYWFPDIFPHNTIKLQNVLNKSYCKIIYPFFQLFQEFSNFKF